MRPVPNRRGLWVALVVVLGALTGMPSAVAATANRSARIEAPRATGALLIDGVPRDGDTVRAAGLSWRPGHLRAGQRLLSFEIAYRWRVCATQRGPCVPAADETVTPFAANRYVVGHDDVGRHLRLTETATEAVETDPATFTFRVVRASRSVTSPEIVRNDARGQAPTIGFVNGTPDKRTGSREENFQVTDPHFNTADGTPVVRYRVDRRSWLALPTSRVFRPEGWAWDSIRSACAQPTARERRPRRSGGGSFHCTGRGRASPGTPGRVGIRSTSTAAVIRCGGTGRSAASPRSNARAATRWTSTTSTAS